MKITDKSLTGTISNMTGLPRDVVAGVIRSYKLLVLSSVLESQFEDKEIEVIEFDTFRIYTEDGAVEFTEKFQEKILSSIKGSDYLSEAVFKKFSADVISKLNYDNIVGSDDIDE